MNVSSPLVAVAAFALLGGSTFAQPLVNVERHVGDHAFELASQVREIRWSIRTDLGAIPESRQLGVDAGRIHQMLFNLDSMLMAGPVPDICERLEYIRKHVGALQAKVGALGNPVFVNDSHHHDEYEIRGRRGLFSRNERLRVSPTCNINPDQLLFLKQQIAGVDAGLVELHHEVDLIASGQFIPQEPIVIDQHDHSTIEEAPRPQRGFPQSRFPASLSPQVQPTFEQPSGTFPPAGGPQLGPRQR